ncbi:MAG: carotenoid 1,2-hydratase [Gammaproteobacteria bacterium]|jgi:predicted secreted hydrolase|nr:carotenoid 1,2-hydratase [Gammaproteobacteria bacterium]MDH3756313.1 carotenoid 1,2-hydratase [Gammaproteobacteria bacterium]MDH3846185.1 carotenoid 1,2-hydratase [Gammaproteobacteria bacterium]MDH3862455.1 carotenoid 1,2-hydratase [Gammaproteobacteria bacterium]MDH3905648.1 carotenoid 1,2-hydratase [Gammaproteobacteria bacterium]
MRKSRLLFFAALLLPLTASADDAAAPESRLSGLLSGDGDFGFEKAIEPRAFVFPEDHGPHPEFRNEWWYVTGNLDGENGRRFGFELTIFRFALTPGLTATESNWRSNQVYIAHFAVTDAGSERFYAAERYSRGALGLAGASADPFRVWIDDWEIAAAENASPEQWRLRAADPEFALDVALTAAKPPVLNGVDGLSQKSAEPGNASYYYSITRWLTEGSLRLGDDEYRVSGLSWLDREWSSSALGADQLGWDWFALQLSDGSELMFYNLRKLDGSQDGHSAGTWINADGTSTHIDREDIEIVVSDTWDSPEGGRYPSAWTLKLPQQGLSLEIRPVMADQELFTTVRYWEGAVDIEGERGGSPVEGRGYVELTGYAE